MPVLSRLGPRYWQARFRRWPKRASGSEGYSLLVPVPGDLPVFLRLALAVCRHQDPASRLETIVVPDRVTPLMKDIVDQARRDWPGELVLQALPVPERWVLPRMGNPGRNHASQLIAGVCRSRATHIVLHDADLFLMRPDLHRREFEMCRQRQLACLGISPPWDPWFAEHGRQLAATWELCAQVEWLRSFPPVLHMAHQNDLFGEQHMFDTTFYPQALTDPALIAVSPTDDFVHFNWVISNYRFFLAPHAEPWYDIRFRLFLVRLLVDLFDQEGAGTYRLPSLVELGHCLGAEGGPVRFPERPKGDELYRSFRDLMGRALTGPWVDDHRRQLAAAALAPFDRFYGCEGAQLFPVVAAATGEGQPSGGPPAGN
ncbi:MAG: hypothetical protein ABSE77_18255 [Acidimicrobiales bacterium]